MNDFVQKVYDFILFLVNTIKDLVSSLSGKDKIKPPTTAPQVPEE